MSSSITTTEQIAQISEYLTKKCGFDLKEEQLNKIEHILNKNKKKKRDENAPKTPATAFFLYLNANRQAWKEAYPDQSITQIATGLGERWRNASAETKATFQQASEELRKTYQEAKAKYDTECKTECKEVVPSESASAESVVASTETPKKVKQNKKLDSPSEQPSEPKKKKTTTASTSVVGSKDESKVEVATSVAVETKSEATVSGETTKVVAPKKKKVVKEASHESAPAVVAHSQ